MAIQVMIVEDEGLLRNMLTVALEAQPELRVVGACGDGTTAIRMAREISPDVILMDIDLGSGLNGVQTGIRIKEQTPRTGIVLLSSHKDKAYLDAIPPEQAHGWSYLLKQSVGDVEALTRAVQGAAAGLVVLDASLVMDLRPKLASRVNALTARQGEVLELIAQGYSNSAIAQKLRLGEKSVENYINAIYQKLEIDRQDVHPRVKAVLVYLEDTRPK